MDINLNIPILYLYDKEIVYQKLRIILKRHFNTNGFSERHFCCKDWETETDYYASLQLAERNIPYVTIRCSHRYEERHYKIFETKKLEKFIKQENLWR